MISAHPVDGVTAFATITTAATFATSIIFGVVFVVVVVVVAIVPGNSWGRPDLSTTNQRLAINFLSRRTRRGDRGY